MIRNLALALSIVLILAGTASASSYYAGFTEHWKTSFGKQNTIVVGVLIAGALGIFVITRGRKR